MPEFKLQRLRGGFAFAVYEGGHRVSRKKLEGRDAAAAAAEFQRIIAELNKPVDPTVEVLWNAYREDKAGRRIAANMEFSGKAILPHFGALKPHDIDAKQCRIYTTARRLKGRKNGTIGTELNHLRIVLAWATKTGIIAKAPHLELPPKPAPKELHLTREEFGRLLDASETHHLRVFLNLAIATAGRVGALLDLTWDRVDFERKLVFLGEPEALQPRKGRATVRMNDDLRAALSAAKEVALTDHVIEWAGQRVSSVRTALKKAAARAKLKGVSPHVLRHSAAVWLAQDGHDIRKIAAFLGHSDEATTKKVYARFQPDYLDDLAKSLEVGPARPTKGVL
jgi:integrase